MVTELWNRTLDVVRGQVADQIFNAWIRPLKPAGPLQEDRLELLVANSFSSSYVQSNYAELLLRCLAEEAGRPIHIQYRVDPQASLPPLPEAELLPERLLADQGGVSLGELSVDLVAGEDTTLADPPPSTLDPRYTFDTFVVGACNQFVAAAAERVAENPARAYNPLFIYGGVGLGKTHVMQAIGHKAVAERPGLRVMYTTSEKFMIQLINSLRYKRVHDFKEAFRSVDILMVDDIQFIAGKKATQEEFFHTFNALFEANKQIIMTSDRFPHEIDNLEERLRSRFGWGLVADIQPPDLETRMAILEKKAALEGWVLPKDVCFFLAENIPTNVRELEGALVRVSAYASLIHKPVTLELTRQCLRDIVRGQDKQISVEDIQKTVAAYYKIRPADLRSAKRTRLFSHPRQVAMFLCKQLTKHSYPEIGQMFGGRDHTTVLYAVGRIEDKRETDRNLAEELDALGQMIRK
ncbi:MAG: chromosomal replication initiator protein DnaA [Magnetococcus sp. WYHC-3]